MIRRGLDVGGGKLGVFNVVIFFVKGKILGVFDVDV